MPDPAERRFPRIASHHAVLVKRLGPEAIEEFALTTSIARGGCCFVTAEALGEGSLLDLLITIDHEVVRSRARVIYEQPREGDDGQLEVGVEFLNLDDLDAARIEKLFNPATTA